MSALESSITAVTIYPDRARVTRQGMVKLDPGIHRLEVAGLPLRLDASSARAAARGTARARLLSLDVERTFHTETPAEAVRQLEQQLETAQDELLALQVRIARLDGRRQNLDAIAGHSDLFATALAAGEQSASQQASTLGELHAQAGKLEAERLSLLVEQRAQERLIQQLRSKLDALRGQRPRERFSAWINLEVLQPGEWQVELTYVVSGAGWKPLYDLRLCEGERSSLEVGYLAEVRQTSGEDWPEAELTLSTARPAISGALPELHPWYIAPLPPPAPPKPFHKAARAGMAAGVPAPMMAMPDAMPDAAMMSAEMAAPMDAEVETSGIAVTYRIPGTASVPGDGSPHKLTVATINLLPRIDYLTAPEEIEAVYRRAKVVNDSPYTLLPGAVNLFAGDEFIGASELELTASQGEIKLFLGVDDRIKVKRELKRREVDKTLLGGKRRIHFGYEISLENLLSTEAGVVVQDRIPTPRHEEIKVRLDNTDPAPTHHSELNLLDWELRLAPKEKRRIRYDFTVEIPQTMETNLRI